MRNKKDKAKGQARLNTILNSHPLKLAKHMEGRLMQQAALPSIMVIDHDEGIRESFEEILGDDYIVLTAENSKEALDAIIREEPALLFLDMSVTNPDGYQILQWIKRHRYKTSVVLLTTLSKTKYAALDSNRTVSQCLCKPFGVDEVQNIVRSIMVPQTM